MLRRKDREGKTVRASKRKIDAQLSPAGRQEMDVMVGDAMVEADQISMSASRMDAGLSKVVNHAKDTGEKLGEQEQRIARMRQETEELRREVTRLRELCEGEQACRLFVEKKILEMIDHSKHYTSLVKALSGGPAGGGASDDIGEERRKDKLHQLVLLLKENNITLTGMAKELAQQRRVAEQEPPFSLEKGLDEVQKTLEISESCARENASRQRAILDEMETVGENYIQQQESVGKLEELLNAMKRQLAEEMAAE